MPLLDLLWAMLWFFLFIAWIWLLIMIITDVFRSDDLGGWGKALWVLFIAILPLLGTLIYLIARGSSMQQRAVKDVAAREKMTTDYIRSVAGGGSAADELTKLADLRRSGAITEEEFAAQKAKLLAV